MCQGDKLEKWVLAVRDSDFIRFGIVGVLNTIIGTSVMFFSYNVLGMGYWISSALNYIVGSVFSYFANKHFTFKSKKKSWKEIVRFVVNVTICYLLAYGIAKPVTLYIVPKLLKLPLEVNSLEQIAMLMGMICFVGFNYLGQKFFVFKDN